MPAVELANRPVAASSNVSDFLKFNFANIVHEGYPDLAAQKVKSYPPEYEELYRRIILMAAEYGFPEAGAHASKFGKVRGDAFHPFTLLALASYLGGINVQATYQKDRATEHWKLIQGELADGTRKEILAQWTMPSDGAVDLPDAQDFLKEIVHPPWVSSGTRLTHGLPIYEPDREFHVACANLNFTKEEAHQITNENFVELRLGEVINIFGERSLPAFQVVL